MEFENCIMPVTFPSDINNNFNRALLYTLLTNQAVLSLA